MVLPSPISRRVGSPAYFLSCGGAADGTRLGDAVVAADGGVALDHAVRADASALVDAYLRTDQRIGGDLDVLAESRAGVDMRGGMDAGHRASGQPVDRHQQLGFTASSSPTSARALNFQMLAFMRSGLDFQHQLVAGLHRALEAGAVDAGKVVHASCRRG